MDADGQATQGARASDDMHGIDLVKEYSSFSTRKLNILKNDLNVLEFLAATKQL